MVKTDLLKTDKTYYQAKLIPELIHLESKQYLSLTGIGDPSGTDFSDSLQSLYSTIYAIKFKCKALNKDFTVPKLEGLWWFDRNTYKSVSLENAPKLIPRSEWKYRLMIRLPEFVTPQLVRETKEQVESTKKLHRVKFIEYFLLEEGMVVQVLHVGPFISEPESLLKIQDFMKAHGLRHNGEHHEIYLSDFRKTTPEKLKTILREPVKVRRADT